MQAPLSSGAARRRLHNSDDRLLRFQGRWGGRRRACGGVGAVVGGELLLDAGETLDIVVGEAGESSFNGGVGNGYAGGGGGGSFVFEGALLLFAAGGGGGANFFGPLGSPGIGSGGSPSGPASYGGAGGGGYGDGFDFSGGGSEFSGGQDAQSGSFPYGGNGAKGYWGTGPSGGYGGGGGAGYNLGGGGAVRPGAERVAEAAFPM
jgi:hypothetical protein